MLQIVGVARVGFLLLLQPVFRFLDNPLFLVQRQFAQQHARWWDRPELSELAWLPAWNEPAMVEFAVGAYAQVWPAVAAAFEDSLPAEAVALGGRLADILGDMMNHVAAPPFTLAHGDARHENLMFDPADDSAAPHVIDWQLTSRGRGVMDVAYYLTQSGPADIAATHERALVERYHEELCRGAFQTTAWRAVGRIIGGLRIMRWSIRYSPPDSWTRKMTNIAPRFR